MQNIGNLYIYQGKHTYGSFRADTDESAISKIQTNLVDIVYRKEGERYFVVWKKL